MGDPGRADLAAGLILALLGVATATVEVTGHLVTPWMRRAALVVDVGHPRD